MGQLATVAGLLCVHHVRGSGDREGSRALSWRPQPLVRCNEHKDAPESSPERLVLWCLLKELRQPVWRIGTSVEREFRAGKRTGVSLTEKVSNSHPDGLYPKGRGGGTSRFGSESRSNSPF